MQMELKMNKLSSRRDARHAFAQINQPRSIEIILYTVVHGRLRGHF